MKKSILLITCIIAGLCSRAQNCTPILPSDLPLTILMSPNSGNICPGQSITLQSSPIHPSVAGGNYDFLWFKTNLAGSPIKATLSTTTATTTATILTDYYTVLSSDPGLYTLMIRDHDNPNATACQYSANVTITANPAPSYIITGGGSYCSNSTAPKVNINLSGTPPFTLSWSNGTTSSTVKGINSTPYSITPTNTGTFTITAISDNDCPGVATNTSVSVTKIQQPDLTWDATTDTVYCYGNNTTLLKAKINTAATAATGYSYKWMNITNNIDMGNTTSPILQSPTGTKSYGLTVTDSVLGLSCNQVMRPRIIIQNTLPTYTITGGATYCKGSIISPIKVNISNGIPPYKITYADGGGAVYTVTVSGTNPITYTIPQTVTGMYPILAITDASPDACSTIIDASKTATITVNPKPTITSAFIPPSCAGTVNSVPLSSLFTFSPSGGPATYTCSSAIAINGTSFMYTSNPGTYTVSATYSANGCASVGTNTITVYGLPTITANANQSNICKGGYSNLSATGADSYVWSSGLGSGNSKTISPTISTTYFVTGTDIHGCVNTASVGVTSNSLPSITAIAIPTIINIGSTATISASGAISYMWSNSITSATQTVTPISNTTYLVTGTDANNCMNTASIIITVNQAPTVTPTPPNGSGTSASPYEIASINNLYWLSQNSSAWSSTFIQTADIDASSLASSVGFSPIGKNMYQGTPFSGKYDGQNHIINNLTINRNATSYIGLFGSIRNATISNLGLTNVAITGMDYTGALAGQCSQYDTITNCFSTGKITGNNSNPIGYLTAGITGGLIGSIEFSKITNSYSACTVNGGDYAGGLIGSIVYDQGNNSSISNCYASGSVTGNNYVGGLIGNVSNAPTITNCYATGTVTGTNSVGGFAGSVEGAFGSLIISKCYSSGNVVCSGTSKGGFIATNINYPNGTGTGTISNCFWNTETSGLANGFFTNTGTITSLTGVTSAQMKTQSTFTNAGWDYKYETTNGTDNNWVQYDYVNSGYPSLTWQINYWNGTGNWNTASNWTPAYLPRANASIVIETGELTYNKNYTIQNACINVGAKLTVNSGLGFGPNNLLLVKSDATGTGSIISNGKCSGANIKVEQYLGGGRNWYIASPIEYAKSSVIKTPLTNKLWNYIEPTATWNEITDATTTLSVMNGYVAYVPHDTIITYGEVGSSLNLFYNSISLTRTGTNSQSGFNLIGNPYLSCVNWESATKTNVEPSIWYRTKNMNNAYVFDSYNASTHVGTNNNGKGAVTQFIPSLQAVWVQVSPTATTGQLLFDNTMLSHPVIGNILKADIELTDIRLAVTNGKNSDETILAFNEQAGNGYDGFDTKKMFNTNNDMPQLFTLADNEKLVINGMKPINISKVIALGFKTAKAGTFTISANEINGLDGVPVILEDKLLNKTQDLTQTTSYTFASDTVNDTTRFAIRLKADNGPYCCGLYPDLESGVNTIDDNSITVFAKGNSIIINSTDINNGTASVFNLLGQEIITGEVTGTTTVIATSIPAGAYFVKIEKGKSVVTKKIIIE